MDAQVWPIELPFEDFRGSPNFVTPPRYAPSRSNSKFLHSSPCLLTTPSRRGLSLSSGGTSRISSSFELFRSNRRQRRARCALINFEHFVGITSVFLPQGGTENVPLFEGAAFSLLLSLPFLLFSFSLPDGHILCVNPRSRPAAHNRALH